MLPLSDALRHPRLHGWARRYLNPWVVRLGLAGGRHSPIGLVLHAGRRSGRPYATPLAIHRHGDSLFIPLTYGPAARWCLNVQAAGACRVRLRGRELAATHPRIVGRGALPRRLRTAYRLLGMAQFLELRVGEPRGSDEPSGPGPARAATDGLPQGRVTGSAEHGPQRAVEIGPQVLDVLDADGEAA